MTRKKSPEQIAAGKAERAGRRAPGRNGHAPSPHPTSTTSLPCCCAATLHADMAARAWLWQDHLMFGALALLEGRKSGGKSTLLCAVAADVTGGPRMDPGRRARPPRDVLWIPGEEDPSHDIRPRLIASAAYIDRVHFPGYDDAGRLVRRIQLPSDTPLLGEICKQLNIGLVVVDPWSSCLPLGASTTDPLTARVVCESLAHLAFTHSVCVIVSRNMRKDRSGDALAHGLGSSELTHVARTVLQIRAHPDRSDWSCVVVAASNAGPAPAPRAFGFRQSADSVVIDWRGDVDMTADDLADQEHTPAGRDERRDAHALLAPILAGSWLGAADVLAEARRAGVSESTLRRAKAELRIRSKRVAEQSTAHWLWGPPCALEADADGGGKAATHGPTPPL